MPPGQVQASSWPRRQKPRGALWQGYFSAVWFIPGQGRHSKPVSLASISRRTLGPYQMEEAWLEGGLCGQGAGGQVFTQTAILPGRMLSAVSGTSRGAWM